MKRIETMKCVTITFWEYVKLGLKEPFSNPPKERWQISLMKMLIGALVGLFLAWVLLKVNMAFCLGFVIVVDVVGTFVFLLVNWRKAVRDCWDKFEV